ncbi:hypothetical protein ACSBOB_00850 [Mesorhizobium sp. ASY16-5R]|uniref:hypothetical protein n=1 Tax=Mesorhizobium sp. ASY16-5R TaxID=3445772 RepID=UPI003FA07F19
MSRARKFTRVEIMDAARAASEHGLDVKLCPTGEIVFMHNPKTEHRSSPTPDEAFEEWLNGRKARGLAKD